MATAHRIVLLRFQGYAAFQGLGFLPLIGGAIQAIDFTTGKFFAVGRLKLIACLEEKLKVDFATPQGVEDRAEFPLLLRCCL